LQPFICLQLLVYLGRDVQNCRSKADQGIPVLAHQKLEESHPEQADVKDSQYVVPHNVPRGTQRLKVDNVILTFLLSGFGLDLAQPTHAGRNGGGCWRWHPEGLFKLPAAPAQDQHRYHGGGTPQEQQHREEASRRELTTLFSHPKW
jgi:hypothetical protein